jgi:hypothetical protein
MGFCERFAYPNTCLFSVAASFMVPSLVLFTIFFSFLILPHLSDQEAWARGGGAGDDPPISESGWTSFVVLGCCLFLLLVLWFYICVKGCFYLDRSGSWYGDEIEPLCGVDALDPQHRCRGCCPAWQITWLLCCVLVLPLGVLLPLSAWPGLLAEEQAILASVSWAWAAAAAGLMLIPSAVRCGVFVYRARKEQRLLARAREEKSQKAQELERRRAAELEEQRKQEAEAAAAAEAAEAAAVRQRRAGQTPFALHVRTMAGASTEIDDVWPSDTVAMLKRRVEAVEGTAADAQRLIIDGRILDGPGDLESLGLGQSSVISLVLVQPEAGNATAVQVARASERDAGGRMSALQGTHRWQDHPWHSGNRFR